VALLAGFELMEAERADGTFRLTASDGRVVRARYAVNAAGLHADRVSALFGAEAFRIRPRKGEEFLLDRNARGLPSKVIYPVPTPVSKGILVIPTVEGTCMVGPTAVEIEDKQDLATSRANLEIVFASARRLVPALSERDIITSFAGLRPTLEGGDFLIESSGKVPALVQAAGLQSPGLTASPAVAEYVKDLLKKAGLALEEKPDWNPCLPEVPRMRELTPSQVDELTRRDPAYGEVVCRCEGVSEAEIVAAVRRGHRTLDGIKFYTRAQMGRCQGGFCTYRILRILARETGLPVEAISKRGPGSEVLGGVL
jgi:glycerol-3-phosphate dehydrogenase